jgi:hypothetical protein
MFNNDHGPLIVALFLALMIVAYLGFNYEDFRTAAVGGYSVLAIFAFFVIVYWDKFTGWLPS